MLELAEDGSLLGDEAFFVEESFGEAEESDDAEVGVDFA